MITPQEENNPHSRPPTLAERVLERIVSACESPEDEDEEEAER